MKIDKFRSVESICDSIRKACMQVIQEENEVDIASGGKAYYTPSMINRITNYLADDNNVLKSILNRVNCWEQGLLEDACEDGYTFGKEFDYEV